MRILTLLATLALAAPLAGCAGGWRNGAPPGADAAAAPATGAAKPAAAQGAGGVTFTWEGAAQSVHLTGEFNGWSTSADPLTKNAQGAWTITKQLEPGRHPYKFVIDGTSWKEDPNAAESADDGHGGKNSIVAVGDAAGAAGGAAAAPAAKAGSATAGRAPEVGADGAHFYFAGSYRTVHLAGDFNGWSTTADPLQVGEDGLWTIHKKLEPGVYAYKFVVDGSIWKQDEANPESVDDGFGGKNSVITVK